VNFLHNITANNGWAMAATGAIIVLMGLAVLSFIISQLHRFIDFFESHSDKRHPSEKGPEISPASADVELMNDPAAAARIYQPMTADLGEAFELSKLYELFKQENIPHPHLTIRSLRDAGYLVEMEEQLFGWKI
jgi:hypothetical protein